MAAVQMPPESVPTADLVKQTLVEARDLVKLEVRIAKEELEEDLLEAKRAAYAGVLAVALGLLALAALVVAVILAIGGTPGAAVVVAVGLGALTAISAASAYAAAPKSLLAKTRRHLEDDATALKGHAA
jgi:uncharacterized membrane protein YqjE